MAVSHQWFVQWSAPPVLLADISSRYNNVNERWKTENPQWSDDWEIPEQSGDKVNYYSHRDNYINHSKNGKVNDKLKNDGKSKRNMNYYNSKKCL